MKATVNEVDLSLLAATFLDVIAWNTGLRQSLSGDFVRLERIIATRGISFLVDDMPRAGKVLDKALSGGYINSEDLPHTFGRRFSGCTRSFLNSLFRGIFYDTGDIRPEFDINYVLFLRQILYLCKALDSQCSEENIEKEIIEFGKIETSMRVPTLSWDLDHLDTRQDVSFSDVHRREADMFSERETTPLKLINCFQRVCDILATAIIPPDSFSLVPGHGPGAVSDIKTGTDKYLFPNWPRKLDQYFPMSLFVVHREDLISDDVRSLSIHEPPARLIAVPKTPLKPRLIASEPACHQYCQQALMRWFRDSIPKPLRGSISFTDQTLSKKMVQSGSLSGKLASVDLSSASDRLSCWAIERTFRKNPKLLDLFHSVRTRWVFNPSGLGNWKYILLRKYANQGSAITFPLQTYFYACVCSAVLLFERGLKPNNKNIGMIAKEFRVFGDDILISSDLVPSLCSLLTYLGLKVNMGKTHFRGYFRESCGMDTYKGVDVTPLYLSNLSIGEKPGDLVSWIDVSNNAYRKGLWTLSQCMLGSIPQRYRESIPVTNRSLGCLTLFTYQECCVVLKKKWCKSLHRFRTPGYQVRNKAAQGERSSHLNLLQYFVEKPHPEVFWHAGFKVRNRLKLIKRWVHI